MFLAHPILRFPIDAGSPDSPDSPHPLYLFRRPSLSSPLVSNCYSISPLIHPPLGVNGVRSRKLPFIVHLTSVVIASGA